jgi:flagellar biosynthesis component FlhA
LYFILFLLLSCITLSSFSFPFSFIVSSLFRFLFYIFLQFPFLHFVLYSFQLLSSVLIFLVFPFFILSTTFSLLPTILCLSCFCYHSLNYFSPRYRANISLFSGSAVQDKVCEVTPDLFRPGRSVYYKYFMLILNRLH